MIKYIPIIKTTSSELQGFSNLSDKVRESVLPLFELTRGRTHKDLYPEGRIEKTWDGINEAHPTGKFILDLTSHENLINSEIETLFNSNDGYRAWCSFIERTDCADRITPTIQIDAEQIDSDAKTGLRNVTNQAKRLESLCGSVILRINLNFEPQEILSYADAILKGLKKPNKFIVMFDAEYIRLKTAPSYSQEIAGIANLLNSELELRTFSVAASSFPKTVTASDYGSDAYGKFAIEEVKLHKHLQVENPDMKWIYGDYGSIHPIRYEVKGGSWVPRVDVPLKEKCFYHRFRREDGGYRAAALSAYEDDDYIDIGSWGNKQIEAAADGVPKGLSPSFWISVRCNIHITTQASRVGAISGDNS